MRKRKVDADALTDSRKDRLGILPVLAETTEPSAESGPAVRIGKILGSLGPHELTKIDLSQVIGPLPAVELGSGGLLRQVLEATSNPGIPKFDLGEEIGRLLPPCADTPISFHDDLFAVQQQRHETEAREKEEQRGQSIQTVRLLSAILREIQRERLEREQLAAKVQAHEELLQRYRTGERGRPGSRHLVLGEFKRRSSAGQVAETLCAEARELAEWLPREHPEAHPITPDSIENAIRLEYRRVWGKGKKRQPQKR